MKIFAFNDNEYRLTHEGDIEYLAIRCGPASNCKICFLEYNEEFIRHVRVQVHTLGNREEGLDFTDEETLAALKKWGERHGLNVGFGQ